MNRLTIKTDKTEFNIFFCKSKNNAQFNNIIVWVKDQNINVSKSMKIIAVFYNQNLSHHDEVENVLWKMACRMKIIYAIRDFLPIRARLLFINALVFSRLDYPAFLMDGIS